MIEPNKNADHGTWQRIDYRGGKAAIIRRTSMSYDRLMQASPNRPCNVPWCRSTGGRRWVIAARTQRHPAGWGDASITSSSPQPQAVPSLVAGFFSGRAGGIEPPSARRYVPT